MDDLCFISRVIDLKNFPYELFFIISQDGWKKNEIFHMQYVWKSDIKVVWMIVWVCESVYKMLWFTRLTKIV